MKRIFTLITVCLFSLHTFAQTFSDDFESYAVGSYLGPQSTVWTTWTGASGEGTTTDVIIVNDKAHGGTNSIYFSSTTAGGGPTDIILPFGGELTTGQFTFKAWFFIPKDKSAYFNFQGKTIVAQDWALQCYLNPDGGMNFDDGSTNLFTSSFPNDVWFELTIDVNLNTSNWNILIDGVSKGTFANKKVQIASLDIYPADVAASFWVDDVSYNVVPYTLPNLNAGISLVDVANGWVGTQVTPIVTVRNLGNTTITSFDLTLDHNGTPVTQNISGTVAKLTSKLVTFSTPITLDAGSHIFTATVSNVNGGASDGDPLDDVKSVTVIPIQPAPGKLVVAEEATGTWCGWCPRGAVAMDNMATKYSSYFIGIAVHNNDPMLATNYDAGMGTKISGYPSALVDRGGDIDPSGIEIEFLQKSQIAPEALLINGATYDNVTRELKVAIASTFQKTVSGTYTMACVLTEDDVTGTNNGYDQSNYYAGGGSGVMGGFEGLPNPVPASQMVYNHVARAITNFDGEALFPTNINNGDTFVQYFTFTLDNSWEENNIHIVGVLFNPSGKIDNGSTATIAEAVANGYPPVAPKLTSIKEKIVSVEKETIKLFPNPANQNAFVKVNLKNDENVGISIYKMDGALVAQRDYGKLSGEYLLPIETKGMIPGLYFIKLNIGQKISVLKLVVE